MMPYMSVTALFVSKDWKPETKCLQTSFMPESHTANNLGEALRETLHNRKVKESNISSVTTDNGANIVAAI
jgi:hypothetical protein